MSDTNLAIFDRAYNDANAWLKQISEEMNHPDRQIAYHALRGVLFSVRDRITLEEAAHFASQLPTMIRGIYFEAYDPSGKPERFDYDGFLSRISNELQKAGGASPESAFHAVFAVLERNISEGQLRQVIEMLPMDVQQRITETVS